MDGMDVENSNKETPSESSTSSSDISSSSTNENTNLNFEFNYRRVQIVYAFSSPILADWISKHNLVIPFFVGKKSHRELVRRSVKLIKLLIKEHCFNDDLLKAIQTCTIIADSSGDDDMSNAVYFLMTELVSDTSTDLNICKNLLYSVKERVALNDNTNKIGNQPFQISKNALNLIAKTAQLVSLPSSYDLGNEALEMLWSLFLSLSENKSEGTSLNENTNKENINELVGKHIEQVLTTYQTPIPVPESIEILESIRKRFMERSVICLKTMKSPVNHILSLLRHIIEAYQSNPVQLKSIITWLCDDKEQGLLLVWFDSLKVIKVDKETYAIELSSRLEFLGFLLYQYSYSCTMLLLENNNGGDDTSVVPFLLTYSSIDLLFDQIIINHQTFKDLNLSFRWFSQLCRSSVNNSAQTKQINILSRDYVAHIFNKICALVVMPPQKTPMMENYNQSSLINLIGISGYRCFEEYFFSLNSYDNSIISDTSSKNSNITNKNKNIYHALSIDQEIEEEDTNTIPIRDRKFIVTNLNLVGFDILWKIALQTPYPKVTLVTSLAISSIQQASAGICDIGETRKQSINNCLNEIQNAMKTIKSENLTSSMRISRSLMLLEAMIRESESESSDILHSCGENLDAVMNIWNSICSHSQSSRGRLLSLIAHDSVRGSPTNGKKIPFVMCEHDPAWLVRYKLAKMTGVPSTSDVRLFAGGAEVTSQMDARALSILRGFGQGSTILVSLKLNAPDIIPASATDQHLEVNKEQSSINVADVLSKLPSHIISSSSNNFDILFSLLNDLMILDSDEKSKNSLIQKVWDLIQLLPTSSSKLKSAIELSTPSLFVNDDKSDIKSIPKKILKIDPDLNLQTPNLSVSFQYHYLLSIITRLLESNKNSDIAWVRSWILSDGFAAVKRMTYEAIYNFSQSNSDLFKCDSCIRQVILETIRMGLSILHDFTVSVIIRMNLDSQNRNIHLLKEMCSFSLIPPKPEVPSSNGNNSTETESTSVKLKEIIITNQDTTWIISNVFDDNNFQELAKAILDIDSNQALQSVNSLISFIIKLSQIEIKSDEIESNCVETDDLNMINDTKKKSDDIDNSTKVQSVQQILLSRSINLELDTCRLSYCLWLSHHIIHQSLFNQMLTSSKKLLEAFVIEPLLTNNRGSSFRALVSKGLEVFCDIYGYVGDSPSPFPLKFFLEILMCNLPTYNTERLNGQVCYVELFDLTKKLLEAKLKIDSQLPESFNTDIAVLTIVDQLKIRIKDSPILEGEPGSAASLFRDDILIGNLRLLAVALSFCSIDHKEQMIVTQTNDSNNVTLLDILFSECLTSLPNFNDIDSSKLSLPKCKRPETIHAALEALFQLCYGSNNVLLNIITKLTPIIEQVNPRLIASGPSGKIMSNSWNIDPEQDKRFPNGFSGLRNLGCICYMNSLIQQFNMIPRVRYGILNSRTNEPDNLPISPAIQLFDFETENLLSQLQIMFAGLHMSLRQAFTPRGWTQSYKNEEGEPVNVLQQQDAQEFFNTTCDRIDDLLKGTPSQGFFTKALGVTIANELICLEDRTLPVRDNPPSTWYCLGLSLGHNNLSSSLKELVAGDILNDYKWNENDTKTVKTLKRACIGGLNDTLVMHLKRFCMNWETMLTEKLNDRFEFPIELDMFPYTKEGLAWESSLISSPNQPKNKFYPEGRNENYYNFELVGIVVHSGASLNSGHYYSYIRAREGRNRGKWFEFNDSTVRNFNISQLDEKTFGGSRKQQSYSPIVKKFSDVEVSVVDNAYMLFYERKKSFGSDTEFILSQSSNNLNNEVVKDISKCLENHEFLPAKLINQLAPQKAFDYIWNDNMRLTSGRFVLNPHFCKFTVSCMNALNIGIARELNDVDETTISNNPELESKISQIIDYLGTYLISILPWTSESHHFSSLCETLDNMFRLVPNRSHMFLSRLVSVSLSGSGENNIFADLLISAPEKGVRQKFALLIISMVKRYIAERNFRYQQQSQQSQQPVLMSIDFEVSLVRSLLAINVMDACAQHWRQFGSFWWMLHGIAKSDPILCRLLAIYGAPVQIADLMLGSDTFILANEPTTALGKYLSLQRRKKPNIGGYYDSPEWEHAIALFSITSCCFDIMSEEDGLECTLLENGALVINSVPRILDFSLPNIDLPIDTVLKRSMLCKSFYSKALTVCTDISTDALGKILSKFSNGWIGYSNNAMELTFEGIEQSSNTSMIKHYFRILFDLLTIKDAYTKNRVLYFVSGCAIPENTEKVKSDKEGEMPDLTEIDMNEDEYGADVQDIDLTKRESFFALIDRRSSSDIPFCVECVHQLFLLTEKLGSLKKLLSKDLNLFAWIPLFANFLQSARIWIREVLDREVPTAQAVSVGTETTNVPIAPVAAAVTSVAPDPSKVKSSSSTVNMAAGMTDTEKNELRNKINECVSLLRAYLNELGLEEALLEGSGLLSNIDHVNSNITDIAPLNDIQQAPHPSSGDIPYETAQILPEMLSNQLNLNGNQ